MTMSSVGSVTVTWRGEAAGVRRVGRVVSSRALAAPPPPGGRRVGLVGGSRHPTRTRASSTDTTPSAEVGSPQFMQELAVLLEADLQQLFTEKGIDLNLYDDNVCFQDPLTQYDGIQGYLFNIQFLRRVFTPWFVLHSVTETKPCELTTRWTMGMKMGWVPFAALWTPEFVFTGTSIMGINPDSGKFKSHTDTWDSIQNQEFLSSEAVKDLIAQILQVHSTPDLETPAYLILKRFASYEVREYPGMVLAEADMALAASSSDTLKTLTSAAAAFQTLSGYIFGANSTNTKMAMTTPVFTELTDVRPSTMQFVVPSSSRGALPVPRATAVSLKDEDVALYAVRKFNGIATQQTAREVADALRADLVKDGVLHASGFKMAVYNDPSTPAFFRRNEVLIKVLEFEMRSSARLST